MTPPLRCSHEPVCRHLTHGWPDYGCDKKICQFDTRRKTPAPASPEKVMLCFGDYWECPIDEEECKVSDICHQRAIQNREHDATICNQTLKELQAWRLKRMNGMLKKDVWIAWNEETDRINESLRTQSTQERAP